MYLYTIFAAYFSIVLELCMSNGVDRNEYDDINVEKIKKKGGTRLVGARAADHDTDAPFLVALSLDGRPVSSCTGNLITPTFIITAAHCTSYIPREERLVKNKQCVEKTAAGHNFLTEEYYTIQCRILPTFDGRKKKMMKNLEIIPLDPVGKVWMGVNNMNDLFEVNNRTSSKIKRVIMPEHAYQGGGRYGHYGGYDIALIEADQPFTTFQLACLPSPRFDDYADSKLAGYGKYFRTDLLGNEICQTNQYGPMKYHYCKSKCSTRTAPPSSRTCRLFFRHHKVPEDKEEVMILKGRKTQFCFRDKNAENQKYGWCFTKGDYFKHPEKREAPRSNDWGFCSSDCFLDKNKAMFGVLRIVEHVEILPKNLCDYFLEKSFRYGPVSYRPKILCVGRVNHWSTNVWGMQGKKFNRISLNTENTVKRRHYGEYLGFGGYVASPGTCSGDSGGPVYQEQIDPRTGRTKYVVTGAVSGGRGRMGACGGINNPVHYTKLQSFVTWISRVLGNPENRKLCWDNEFEEILRMKGIWKP